MKAICVDGTEVSCKNFKSVEGGVVLTRDKKRKKVIGFVPNGNLSYVLPDDVDPAQSPGATASASDDEAASEGVSQTDGDDELYTTADEDAEDGAVDDDTDAEAADDVAAAREPDTAGDDADSDVDDPDDTVDRGDAAAAVDDGDDVAGLVGGEPDATTIDPEEDLRRLAGLGDTYAERLRAAGVETVSDLRGQSVDEVVDAARVPRGRAERWLRLVTARDDAGTDANAEEGGAAASPVEGEPSETEASESG